MSENIEPIDHIGPSPFTYTNNSDHPEIIIIHGCNTLNIIEFIHKGNAVEIFNTAYQTYFHGGLYYLPIGDSIKIYYTNIGNAEEKQQGEGAPSMYKCSTPVIIFNGDNPT